MPGEDGPAPDFDDALPGRVLQVRVALSAVGKIFGILGHATSGLLLASLGPRISGHKVTRPGIESRGHHFFQSPTR